MKNYVNEGKTLRVVAGADIASGDPVVVGALLGVAHADAANGANVILDLEGVFTMAKVTVDVIAAGEVVDFDISTGEISNAVAATGDLVGAVVAMEAADGSTSSLKVKLLPGNASVSA